MSTRVKQIKSLVESMFILQDDFNKKVHPEWIDQGYAYKDAIWVECAEMMDHLGYKWWKHQEPDMNQVIMEMVDIWHFIMSDIMVMSSEDFTQPMEIEICAISNLIGEIENDFVILGIDEIKEYTSNIVYSATHPDPYDSYPDLEAFFTIWYGLGKNFDELFKMYIGKNALNIFRQNNGYKDGTYVKIWDGREDNEYLTHHLKTATVSNTLMDGVLEFLQHCYTNRENLSEIVSL